MRAEVVLSLWAVIALSDIQAQPCPEVGRDTFVQVYPSLFRAQDLQGLLGGDPGGVWTPEFSNIASVYDPCWDGEGEFTYVLNTPGCPPDSATVTIQLLWDPCAWRISDVCFNGTQIYVTIPPFPGDHPSTEYELSLFHI